MGSSQHAGLTPNIAWEAANLARGFDSIASIKITSITSQTALENNKNSIKYSKEPNRNEPIRGSLPSFWNRCESMRTTGTLPQCDVQYSSLHVDTVWFCPLRSEEQTPVSRRPDLKEKITGNPWKPLIWRYTRSRRPQWPRWLSLLLLLPSCPFDNPSKIVCPEHIV